MRDLLFNVPWWIPTILLIAGVILWVSGNRRQHDRTRTIGWALMLLALVWATVSYLVDTPKEKCLKLTREFIQSVVDRKWSTFDSLMEPDVDFNFVDSPWRIDGRQAIDDAVKGDVDQIGLKGAHATSTEATEQNETVVVRCTVWSDQEMSMGRPLDSKWEFEWRQSNGRWLIRQIRGVQVANLSPDEIRGSLRKH
ncbi:MAG TPA: hypothetical protein VN541_00710 [Tepidisphaeraceae bacterium]|nr:hypothetical protein [Tepidisphaeraceae bacterium]